MSRPLRTLNDTYELLRELGSGGHGTVYEGRHLALNRPVAVKMMRLLGGEASRAAEARFVREARRTSKLRHPHNVTVYDFGLTREGELFLVMDLIEGSRLDALPRPMPSDRALRIADQIAGALGEAHGLGLVHRDIKHANVMVARREDGDHAYVLDYGIAKAVEESMSFTVEGHFVGSLPYAAPEQARAEPVDHRTDIYALGVVLYELLSGGLPFRGTVSELVMQIVGARPPAFDPELRVPREVAQLVDTMLAKDPRDRPQSMDEVRAHIRALLATASVGGPGSDGVLGDVVAGEGDLGPALDAATETATAEGWLVDPASLAGLDEAHGAADDDPPLQGEAHEDAPLGRWVWGGILLALVAVAFWAIAAPSLSNATHAEAEDPLPVDGIRSDDVSGSDDVATGVVEAVDVAEAVPDAPRALRVEVPDVAQAAEVALAEAADRCAGLLSPPPTFPWEVDVRLVISESGTLRRVEVPEATIGEGATCVAVVLRDALAPLVASGGIAAGTLEGAVVVAAPQEPTEERGETTANGGNHAGAGERTTDPAAVEGDRDDVSGEHTRDRGERGVASEGTPGSPDVDQPAEDASLEDARRREALERLTDHNAGTVGTRPR